MASKKTGAEAITEAKLARIRKAKPLAGLGSGWARGVDPTKATSTPPPPNQAWGCIGPVQSTGDRVRWVCTVTAPSWFAAREMAALELECELHEVTVEVVSK